MQEEIVLSQYLILKYSFLRIGAKSREEAIKYLKESELYFIKFSDKEEAKYEPFVFPDHFVNRELPFVIDAIKKLNQIFYDCNKYKFAFCDVSDEKEIREFIGAYYWRVTDDRIRNQATLENTVAAMTVDGIQLDRGLICQMTEVASWQRATDELLEGVIKRFTQNK